MPAKPAHPIEELRKEHEQLKRFTSGFASFGNFPEPDRFVDAPTLKKSHDKIGQRLTVLAAEWNGRNIAGFHDAVEEFSLMHEGAEPADRMRMIAIEEFKKTPEAEALREAAEGIDYHAIHIDRETARHLAELIAEASVEHSGGGRLVKRDGKTFFEIAYSNRVQNPEFAPLQLSNMLESGSQAHWHTHRVRRDIFRPAQSSDSDQPRPSLMDKSFAQKIGIAGVVAALVRGKPKAWIVDPKTGEQHEMRIA